MPGWQGSSSFLPSWWSPRLGSGSASTRTTRPRIANTLADHKNRLVVVEGFCVVYAAMFPIYLWKLYDRFLHTDAEGSRALGSLLLVGGVLFVALHAVSDIGIYGVLDGKLATFGAQHDHSVSYTLYLLTYAVDSVADVFGSIFAFAAGVLVFRSGVLPRWLGWVSMLAAPLLFLQAFGLGGVIASFGLVLDLSGFVLLLLFVLVSSVILLREESAVGDCQRSDWSAPRLLMAAGKAKPPHLSVSRTENSREEHSKSV